MKLNRKWMLLVALVLSVAMATTGTLAYLTDEDKDVNTMTLGKVEVVQNEQKWNEDKTELIEYKNDEPLYPYIGKLGWTQTDYENGAYRQFTMKNVQDKYVTVTNTGKSDAYVRTIIAAEMGEYATVDEFRNKVIGFSRNVENGDEFKFPGAWVWENFQVVELEDGNNYLIMTAVHQNPVRPGETTIPSLLQVYMNKECDNEEVEKVDGNKNGKYDIIALSQAIQVNGFEEMGPAAALNEGFGEVTEENLIKWLAETEIGSPDGDKNNTNNPPEKELPTTKWADYADTSWFDASKAEFTISTASELAGLAVLEDTALAGKTVKLDADVDLGEHLWEPIGAWGPENKFVFDGQNHTVSNMTIASGADVGLFGHTTATIKNVVIDKANITSRGRSAFVSAKNYGDIINCHVTNSVIEDSYWAVGGIAGLYNAGNISDCSLSYVRITSNGGTGGIVGVLNESGGVRSIENCHVYNSVINNTGAYGEAYSGAGIVGMFNISDSTVNISDCTVDATLKGEYIYEIHAPADEDVTVVVE